MSRCDIPASPVQRGIWVTERTGRAGSAFHLGLGIRFRGPLDVAALRSACAAVVRRHDILRLVAAEEGGELLLVPGAEVAQLAGPDVTAGFRSGAVEEPFDLCRGPLVRFALGSAAPDRHDLVVAAHHLVFDGISKDILVRELATAYDAALAGAGADPFGAPPPSYRDAAAAHREREDEQLTLATRHWREHWREPDGLVLPGLTRTPVDVGPGAAHEFVIGPELCRALDRAAAELRATRFEILLSAVHVLLRRYGNRDATVAVDLSTRTAATRHSIGPFVNELPIGAPDPAPPTFRGYVRAVRSGLREVYRFRSVPLGRVLPAVRPRPALAPVSVSYRRQGGDDPRFTGLGADVRWIVPHRFARNAVQIQLVDRGSHVATTMQYNASAVPADTIAASEAHLRTLLGAALSDVDAVIDRLPLVEGVERHRILVDANRTARRYPPDTTVLGLFRSQVERDPGAPALIAGDRTWTYGELDAAAGHLAGLLERTGVRPGDLVGVRLDRSADLVVAVLAVARAGAAHVPVDPTYPEARQELILADARPALILDGSPVRGRGGANGTVPGGRHPDRQVGPDDRAYVIYTSGSTGVPKGVEISHRSLANLLQAMRDAVETGPGDVWLAHTSFAFDISALELLLPLACGATVLLASTSDRASGADLLRLVRRHRVTHLQATPSAWQLLIDAGFGASPQERGSVVALCGGEALPGGLARDLRGRVARLFNVYGPTETTIWSTLAELPDPVREVTIGRPIANTEVYVCDGAMQPVPAGAPGELYIGGAGLALGYHRRPQLTAQRFVPNPFGPPGSRLYRTGDRVSWRPDGALAFHGRSDDQVKIRGHRVELGEVESRLREHPAVAGAAAAVHPDGGDRPVLVGYLVLKRDAPRPRADELRGHLGQTLPAAMVPTAWVVLDRLPSTPNGKLDRRALPPPGSDALPLGNDPPGADPRTGDDPPAAGAAVVARLTLMWQDALQVAEVGVDDDLFDLGGHSLTVMQLVNRIAAELGAQVSLDEFYDDPTVAGVAAAVQRLAPTEQEAVR